MPILVDRQGDGVAPVGRADDDRLHRAFGARRRGDERGDNRQEDCVLSHLSPVLDSAFPVAMELSRSTMRLGL